MAPEPAPARDVPVTNRDKVFFPEKQLTKGDLLDYYQKIAPWMLPYLADRPLVLTRFPDGIHGKSFYQRDAPAFVPDWVERKVLWSESAEREVHYFVAQNTESLLYLANMGAIPIHARHSRITDLEHPDWCVLDLDPKDAPFARVIAAAKAIEELLGEIELPGFLKTSGASGLHVLLPLARQLTHALATTLGELLARIVVGPPTGDLHHSPHGAPTRAEGVHRLLAKRPRSTPRRAAVGAGGTRGIGFHAGEVVGIERPAQERQLPSEERPGAAEAHGRSDGARAHLGTGLGTRASAPRGTAARRISMIRWPVPPLPGHRLGRRSGEALRREPPNSPGRR